MYKEPPGGNPNPGSQVLAALCLSVCLLIDLCVPLSLYISMYKEAPGGNPNPGSQVPAALCLSVCLLIDLCVPLSLYISMYKEAPGGNPNPGSQVPAALWLHPAAVTHRPSDPLSHIRAPAIPEGYCWRAIPEGYRAINPSSFWAVAVGVPATGDDALAGCLRPSPRPPPAPPPSPPLTPTPPPASSLPLPPPFLPPPPPSRFQLSLHPTAPPPPLPWLADCRSPRSLRPAHPTARGELTRGVT